MRKQIGPAHAWLKVKLGCWFRSRSGLSFCNRGIGIAVDDVLDGAHDLARWDADIGKSCVNVDRLVKGE
jgi:hypothetical protein